jgi:hypothetical protein
MHINFGKSGHRKNPLPRESAARGVPLGEGSPAWDEMIGKSSVLRIEGFRTSTSSQEPHRLSQKPISELRRRMLEDIALRKYSEAPCRNYLRHVAEFAKFLGRSPDTTNGGGCTPFPGAYDRERCTAAEAK